MCLYDDRAKKVGASPFLVSTGGINILATAFLEKFPHISQFNIG